MVVGNQLIVTQLGPEASGIYQCFVTNNIGCDHKEINLNVSSVSIATSSNTSVSVIDPSSTDSSSALINPTLPVVHFIHYFYWRLATSLLAVHLLVQVHQSSETAL